MQTQVSHELILLFSTLVKEVRHGISQALKDQGYKIAPPDITILSLIYRQPGMSLQTLVISLGKDKAQITRKVKELEQKGLLSRQRDPEDNRSYQLFLTVEGKRVQTETHMLREGVYQKTFAHLEAVEQNAMISLLNKCLDKDLGKNTFIL